MANILSNIPNKIENELIETLIESENCKIERIISKEHITPKGKWYDQNENEFVIVVKGEADLLIKDKLVHMKEGDYINIPAHTKHRVEKTDKETIWLSVFYK